MVQNMTCPKCQSAMETVAVGEYVVIACTGCAGLWFDLREHEHIAESKAEVARLDCGDPKVGAQQNAKRDILCPVCHVKMLKLTVPDQLHIQYESCPVCYGAFFDAGEFRDYAHLTVGEQVAGFFLGFRRRSGCTITSRCCGPARVASVCLLLGPIRASRCRPRRIVRYAVHGVD